MNTGPSSASSRNSSTTGSLTSRNSSYTTYRTRRRIVGDTVVISSSSKLHVNVDSKFVNSDSENAPNFGNKNGDMVSENIRHSRDLPKMRNRIFEESLESQEVSFYIDDDSKTHDIQEEYEFDRDSLDTTFDDSDTEVINEVPLPKPPTPYGIGKLAKSFNRIKKNISKDLGKSLRRFSHRMSTYIEPDIKDPDPEEHPAPITIVPQSPQILTLSPQLPAQQIPRPFQTDQLRAPPDQPPKKPARSPQRLAPVTPTPLTPTPVTPTHVQLPLIPTQSPKIPPKRREKRLPPPQAPPPPPPGQQTDNFLNRLRRSMSLSPDAALTITSKIERHSRSTFYISEPVCVDVPSTEEIKEDSGVGSLISGNSDPDSRVKSPRPKSPPPPLPVKKKGNDPILTELRTKSPPAQPSKKSLYSEAGLFKNNNFQSRSSSTTSWYAESGLYPKSNNSSSSSTKSFNQVGYSNVINELSWRISQNSLNTQNTTQEYSINSVKSDKIREQDAEGETAVGSFENEYNSYNTQSVCSFTSSDSKKDDSSVSYTMSKIKFLEDEPLYQFYDADVYKSMCCDDDDDTSNCDSNSDIYEEVGFLRTNDNYVGSTPTPPEVQAPPPEPPELPARQVIRQTSITLARSLWCDVPEVKNSAVLSQLSSQQKKLQEAKFEIITSEASYLNSLNVLQEHFVDKIKASNIVNEKELNILFGKVKQVRNCSKRILHDLEKCWQENILLHTICDTVRKHAEENFDVYISYCENQILINETLNALRERQDFQSLLEELETSFSCRFLSMYSFLMLPMQRITRWPLLIDAILKRLDANDPEHLTCQYALASLNKIANQCNEAARKKEREIELMKVSQKLEFPEEVPFMDIVSPDRWLIKSGCMIWIQPRVYDSKMTLGRRCTKIPLQIFMFNDLLLIAKKKSEECFTVLHYCQRNFFEVRPVDAVPLALKKEAQDKNPIYIVIFENHEGNNVEMLLCCPSETEKERWLEVLSPPKSSNPDETIYECWDCPQVMAVYNYTPQQPDELALKPGDVMNVLRKLNDGWYNGERLRDGQTGWFPSNYTQEILNRHVRARNIKQRYRLLEFSAQYLSSKSS